VAQRRQRLRRAREESRGRFREGSRAVRHRDKRCAFQRFDFRTRKVSVGDGGGDRLERRAHGGDGVQLAVVRPLSERALNAAEREQVR
jgi:hypothetical protein